MAANSTDDNQCRPNGLFTCIETLIPFQSRLLIELNGIWMDCVAHLEGEESEHAPFIRHSPHMHLPVSVMPLVNAHAESGSGNLKGKRCFNISCIYLCTLIILSILKITITVFILLIKSNNQLSKYLVSFKGIVHPKIKILKMYSPQDVDGFVSS